MKSPILVVSAIALLMTILSSGGCRSTDAADRIEARARFFLETSDDSGYTAVAKLPASGAVVPLNGQAILSEYDYEEISVEDLELGPCLLFSLKLAARNTFYQITADNIGMRLVLLVNGEAVSARVLKAPIADGNIYMYLELPDEEARALGQTLKEANIAIQKRLSR